MTFEPCLCGDPYCQRCFPGGHEDDQQEDRQEEDREQAMHFEGEDDAEERYVAEQEYNTTPISNRSQDVSLVRFRKSLRLIGQCVFFVVR